MRRVSGAVRNRQRGAALLAFMLVLIVTAATMLVSRLNEHVQAYARNTETQLVLAEAKQALLNFAMNYPEFYTGTAARGPGYLPCPDQNDDGAAQSNCADSTGTTLGRLPYKSLGLPDLRDSAGELLWYAVSQEFKYNQPANHVINSERPGTISVSGSGDVVAVLIAPGAPVSTQTGRRGTAETTAVTGSTVYSVVGQYLEGDNATNPDASYVTSGVGEFNDRVETITRTDLAEVMEKRVVSEIRAALAAYRANVNHGNGRYPWLTPFADPKTSFLRLIGTHTGTSGSATLIDSSRDFTKLGLQAGDVVTNMTDGSSGVISAIATTTLTLSGLSFGLEDDFDTGDEYTIYSQHKSVAGAGSSGTTLVDLNVDFTEIAVSPGDVIDNLTDGSSGVVQTVAATTLTLVSLSGGASNSFSPLANYRIRSDIGVATVGSALTLTDTNNDFFRMGVLVGDVIINLSDGSMGRVASIGANTITASSLNLGTENDFDAGDHYYLPRLNTDYSAREGLLSVHEEGKYFATGFSMNSNLAIAPVTIVDAASPHSLYVANLQGVASGALTSVSASTSEGQCVWMAEGEVNCLGAYLDPSFPVQGTVTSGANTNVLADANADFLTPGVKRGDMVFNFDDEVATGNSGTATAGTSSSILEDTSKNFITLGITPYYHLLHYTNPLDPLESNVRALVIEVINATTLRVAQFQSGDTVDLDEDDTYTIYGPQLMAVASVSSSTVLSASRLVSTPDFDSTGGGGSGANPEFYRVAIATGLTATRTIDSTSSTTTFYDAGANFSEIARGDIVENITDSAFGLITSVNDATDTLTAQLYALDGTTRSFNSSEQYRIYYNHDVVTRRYEFRTRFSGTAHVYTAGNQRKRDVCLGYSSDCQSTSSNVSLPAHSAIVTITDFDGGGSEVAQSRIDIPSSTSGRIKVGGVDYFLREANGELKDWFLANRWHQLVYAAYSSGYAPGGAGDCTTGTDCLNLVVQPPTPAHADREALVLVAGPQLSGQDRSAGGIAGYYESGNATSGDDDFERSELTTSFNDQISTVCPDLLNANCP